MPRGHGYGLRVPHYASFVENGTRADYVEAITENFLDRGGRPRAVLERVRRDARVALHGVSLSVGGVDPLNAGYLRAVRDLSREIEAAEVSDHLCFGTVQGKYGHDLWPLPFTGEALAHVVERLRIAQDVLGRRLLVENVSSYVAFRDSEMTEHEFLAAVAREADAGILLDVNNVYVSARNHGFDATAYIDGIPADRVGQIHLAGHTDHGTHVIDDHGSHVCAEVWDLYRRAASRFGAVPTIVEWDDGVPPLDVLEAESAKARAIEREVLG